MSLQRQRIEMQLMESYQEFLNSDHLETNPKTKPLSSINTAKLHSPIFINISNKLIDRIVTSDRKIRAALRRKKEIHRIRRRIPRSSQRKRVLSWKPQKRNFHTLSVWYFSKEKRFEAESSTVSDNFFFLNRTQRTRLGTRSLSIT